MYDEQALAPSVSPLFSPPSLAYENVLQLFFETTVVKYSNKRSLWDSACNQDVQEDMANAPGEEIVRVPGLFNLAAEDVLL